MEITIPYNFTPRPYQLPMMQAIDNGHKRVVVIAHRRSGKDKTCINIMAKKMLERVGIYYYFAPTYTQGKKIIWDGIDKNGFKFLDHFPPQIVKKKNDSELKIELINGSIFQVIGTDKIDSIVGTNPIGCIFTEYSLQNPKAWDLIRPILAENGGWAIFIFTPRGMNHGWKILQQAQSEGWFHQVLSADETGAIDKEVLEAEKRQMPQDLYEQEYQCKFIEGAASFFKRVDENLWSGDLEPEEGHVYQTGVDLAKYQDWTVITPFDKSTFKVGKQIRFNQMDWNLQKARIEAEARKFSGRVVADSTGIGDPIAEDLERSGLSVLPFKFTETSRRQLLDNLQILLAQDKIKIPNDEGLIGELKSFQFSLTEQGKIKVGVPEGTHDDRVMSLALAVWEATEPIGVAKEEDFGIYATRYR